MSTTIFTPKLARLAVSAAACLALLLAGTSLATAQEASLEEQLQAENAKLRDALRSLTIRMQAAETEAATIKASQTALEEKNARLEREVESTAQRAAADKDLAAQAMRELKAALDKRTAEATQVRTALDEWKVAYERAAEVANAKEGARLELSGRVAELEQEVSTRERNNLELYRVAVEILDRYENFALGKAVLAREPFTGLARVSLENQVQEYKEALLDHRDRIGEVPALDETPAVVVPPSRAAVSTPPRKQ